MWTHLEGGLVALGIWPMPRGDLRFSERGAVVKQPVAQPALPLRSAADPLRRMGSLAHGLGEVGSAVLQL